MGKKKILSNHCREEGPPVGDIMRKPHSSSESANPSILVAFKEQMEGVEYVESSQHQRPSYILHRNIVPKIVIQSPVAVRQRSRTCHNFKRQFIFIKQFFVFRIIVRGGTVEDRVQLFGLLVCNTGILDRGECRPVTQGRIPPEGYTVLCQCRIH